MIKSHPKSRIVQFHHNSDRAKMLLGKSDSEIILQIEAVEHKAYDFLAEIVKREDYEEGGNINDLENGIRKRR